jgi:hypothetical protein
VSDIQVRQEGGRTWGHLTFLGITAKGRTAPRLQLTFTAHPLSFVAVELFDVVVRVEHGQEAVGEGQLLSASLQDGSPVAVEVPTSALLLRYVTSSLVPTAISVDLNVSMRGIGRFTMTSERPGGSVVRMDDPPVGESRDFTVTPGSPALLQVPRTSWFEHVIKPTHGLDFEYLELAMPLVG